MRPDTWRIIRVKVSFTSTSRGFRGGTEGNQQNCRLVEVLDLQRYELSTVRHIPRNDVSALLLKSLVIFSDRARTSVVKKISIFLHYVAFLRVA